MWAKGQPKEALAGTSFPDRTTPVFLREGERGRLDPGAFPMIPPDISIPPLFCPECCCQEFRDFAYGVDGMLVRTWLCRACGKLVAETRETAGGVEPAGST
jgi:hypothetical protein